RPDQLDSTTSTRALRKESVGLLPQLVSVVASPGVLEVLHRSLVLLRGRAALEGPQVAAAPGLRVGFARVEAVFAGLELADHDVLLARMTCKHQDLGRLVTGEGNQPVTTEAAGTMAWRMALAAASARIRCPTVQRRSDHG